MVAAIWRWRGCSVLVVGLYLHHTIEMDPLNVALLTKLIRLILVTGLPFIIGGDWNMSPQTVMDSGLFQGVKAAPVAPAAGDKGLSQWHLPAPQQTGS